MLIPNNKSVASNPINLQGKWNSNISVFLPQGLELNDSTAFCFGASAHVGKSFYFCDIDKGHLVLPSGKVVDFKWELSNDTLNIMVKDTLVQYKIDDVKYTEDQEQMYCRILSEGCKYFISSFIANRTLNKACDFQFESQLGDFVIDSFVENSIIKIKDEMRIDNVIFGYRDKEKKYHYTYSQKTNHLDSYKDVFSIISNKEEELIVVLLVLYENEKMQSVQKMLRLVLFYDEYLSDHIDLIVSEEYPIMNN